MKKNIIHLLLASGFALLANSALISCGKTDEMDANDVLVVKSVLPTKVMEGQVVTITGTGLEKATTVVFPGNVPVKDITKVGNGYISVVTPAGIAAEGGAVTVEADGESAQSVMALTVGKPQPSTVAPLDKEIKINECVEVYGKDLEFITKAYFPGEDGQEIVVPATQFKRKATGSLFIYSPMGIQAGPARVVLEDCSGKRYTLPEVTLSDEISGGEPVAYEAYVTVWQGEIDIHDWATYGYLTTDQLNLEGIVLREGLMIRLTIDNPNGCNVCLYDANWTDWISKDVAAGVNEVEFELTAGMVGTIQSGGGLIVCSGNYILQKVEFFREYPTIWSGEYTTGWWWYLPASELNLSAVTPEAGQTIRLTFAHHDAPQQFCLCDGWWGAPYIRDGGESPNNIMLAGGEDFLDFVISDGMAQTMNGTDTALIIGGDITVTKIQIKVEL